MGRLKFQIPLGIQLDLGIQPHHSISVYRWFDIKKVTHKDK